MARSQRVAKKKFRAWDAGAVNLKSQTDPEDGEPTPPREDKTGSNRLVPVGFFGSLRASSARAGNSRNWLQFSRNLDIAAADDRRCGAEIVI